MIRCGLCVVLWCIMFVFTKHKLIKTKKKIYVHIPTYLLPSIIFFYPMHTVVVHISLYTHRGNALKQFLKWKTLGDVIIYCILESFFFFLNFSSKQLIYFVVYFFFSIFFIFPGVPPLHFFYTKRVPNLRCIIPPSWVYYNCELCAVWT